MVTYRITPVDLHAHLFEVGVSISEPTANQRVALPVWIPGSYMVREFSKHLQCLTARQGGKSVSLAQLDKCTWQVSSKGSRPLELRYQVYAFDNSVRMAFLDAARGFFNPTSLCLRVLGQEDAAHELELVAPKTIAHWHVATPATALKCNKNGWGSYRAANYDALADTPFELGEFWSGKFMAAGVPHRFVVAGAGPGFDGARLLVDAQKICETAIAFWHSKGGKPPFKNYLFMLNAVHEGYGGLEHGNSTALICQRKDLPRLGSARQAEGYTTLQGLISHEYFHAWNVKRLRPAEFERYQYGSEQYTELLWFFEGFTSYFDDLLLRRAGLIDDAAYLKLLNKTINQVMQTPGREVQSVAQASFDAWVKYYRQDENSANATVSYYTKGALVALCMDLSLRQAAGGEAQAATLDAVMRGLWQRCAGGPMAEADLLAVLQTLTGRSWAADLQAWVHSTQDLPLKPLLMAQGVQVHEDPAQLAQRLGIRTGPATGQGGGGLTVKVVLRDSVAEQAGFCAGDEWLALDGWRVHAIDDVATVLAAPTSRARKPVHTALVARDGRVLSLALAPAPPGTTWRLAVRDATKVAQWLAA